jgi:hypothetical protein
LPGKIVAAVHVADQNLDRNCANLVPTFLQAIPKSIRPFVKQSPKDPLFFRRVKEGKMAP